ncbi:helix-turn-helix domain-containing protein [Acidovorax sp. ACV01]|uniref:helix-turn-helix domain-containing protein n=1 Tax=Acidovorax sp. ACV01 TaxID=2769311 RepID=UPI00177F3F10|nr:helix-turn-helix domain-containing protein [Acidovorax sp. ACV01]
MASTPFENCSVPDERLSPAAWHCCADTADVEEHAGSLPEWALQYEQLSEGAFHGRVEQIHLPGAYMVKETMNRSVRQRGEIGRDMYGFALVLQSGSEAICNGQRLDSNALLVGRGDDLDLCNTTASQIGALSVDCDYVNDVSLRIFDRPLASWLSQQVVVGVGNCVADGLRTRLNGALRDAESSLRHGNSDESVLERIRDDMLLAFLDALPWETDTSHLKSIASRRRVVNRAREMMLDRPDSPPSLLEVCRHVGASHRKLNYCFQEVLGMSPARYLRVLRLNGVRRQLRSELDLRLGVQDVAALWGFWHLGQFSADYKRQFAELPSHTLKSSRTRPIPG